MKEWIGRMKQGEAETTWWVLRTSAEKGIHAIVITYVDDFMVLAPREIIAVWHRRSRRCGKPQPCR